MICARCAVRRVSIWALFALLALIPIACQSRSNVSGKVTYNGKPVVFGTILFHGRDGLRQGNIQPDGSYSVLNIAAGDVKVAVNSINPKNIDMHPGKRPHLKPEPYPDAPGWFPIPKKYDNIATSELVFKIPGGDSVLDIDLK